MATFHGSSGNDAIYGTDSADHFVGSYGDDYLDGRGGVDIVNYENITHRVSADLRDERAFIYMNADGSGTQVQTVRGFEHAYGGSQSDTLSGNDGSNLLRGNGGDDTLNGRGGDDFLHGDAGHDVLYGGSGDDMLFGGLGNDRLHGEDGRDTLQGGDGNDELSGGAGDDTLDGGRGWDVIDGGAGHDTVSYASQTSGVRIDLLQGNSSESGGGVDTLVSIEAVVGSAHGDLVIAGSTTQVQAGAGDDVVYSGSGANVLDGGTGADTIHFGNLSQGVTMNLASGVATDGDRFSNFENAVGTRFNDGMVGTNGANRLDGGAGQDVLLGMRGNDVLLGGAGNDYLAGEEGSDQLWGGTGADKFVFSRIDHSTLSAPDVIKDFSRAEGDRIDLSMMPGGFGGGLRFGGNLTNVYQQGDVKYAISTAQNTTRLFIDGDKSGSFETVVEVAGVHHFQASDFILG